MKQRIKNLLSKSPVAYDISYKIARKFGNQTDIYQVLNKFFNKHPEATFIQIGANDGMTNDPFREFIIRKSVRGVLVEPIPFAFRQLKRNYQVYQNKLYFENCAVSYESGREIEFFFLPESYLVHHSRSLAGVHSFSKDHLVKHIGLQDARFIESIKIPCQTVEEILKHYHFRKFDCIFLDVEGYESYILQNLEFDQVSPKLIVYEHTHLAHQEKPIIDLLLSKGFKLQKFIQDTVAIK